MKSLKKMGLTSAFAVAAVVSFWVVPSYAQTFPAGPADDSTSSLGHFRIYVVPQFRPLVTACPGYNTVTSRWDSPVMFDSTTVIGRSGVHQDADGTDTGGAVVGISAPVVVGDSDFLLRPVWFVDGPPGTNEVHTNVSNLMMGPVAGFTVRAGSSAPLRPMSPGEVESKTLDGDDFPAESFFNIHMEVDLPACGAGFLGGTAFNSQPVLIADSVLTDPPGFPPRTIYSYQNPDAVPLYFLGGPYAGQLFGFLLCFEVGMGYAQQDEAEFEGYIPDYCPRPWPPPVPALTPYGMGVLLLILIVAAMWVWRRRRTATT